MSPVSPGRPRKPVAPPPPKTGYRRVDLPTYLRMVALYRAHEGQKALHRLVADLSGVSEPTARKAYEHGLSSSGPDCAMPIKLRLSEERKNQQAIQSVLIAARTAGAGSPLASEQDRQDLKDALGETEFDRVRAEVRAAVRAEIDIVEATRKLAARALRAADRLAKVIDDRTEALVLKFGAKVGADGVAIPATVSDDLAMEVRVLEALGRTGHKAGIYGRLAIEMERLRIGDPDMLRRRLDSLSASEHGPAPSAAPADGAPAEDEIALGGEEVGATEDWVVGLRVIEGGKSTSARPEEHPETDATEDATEDGSEEAVPA